MRRCITKDSLRPRNYCVCHNGTFTAYIKVIPVSTYRSQGWTCNSIQKVNLYIGRNEWPLVKVVEVKYSKTLSAYLFYSFFFARKLGVVCSLPRISTYLTLLSESLMVGTKVSSCFLSLTPATSVISNSLVLFLLGTHSIDGIRW